MIDLVAGVLLLIGASFSPIAGIGLIRLPDVYLRMHAATKAGTLGAGLVLVALALHGQQLEVTARAVTGVLFLLFTRACCGPSSAGPAISLRCPALVEDALR